MCRDEQGCSRAKEKELQPLPGPAGQGHEMGMVMGMGMARHGYSRTLTLQDGQDRHGRSKQTRANHTKQSTTLNLHTSTPHNSRSFTSSASLRDYHYPTLDYYRIPDCPSPSTSCIPPSSFASAPRSPAKHRPCLLFLLIPILIDRASWLSRDISPLLRRSRHPSLVPSDRTNI